MRKQLKEKEKKWEEEEKEMNDRIKTLERVCVCVRVIKNRGKGGEEGK